MQALTDVVPGLCISMLGRYALMMRTTLNIDADLLKQAKTAAARNGRTLTAVVEDALREALARRSSAPEGEPVALPTFRGEGGLMPGVTLDDNAAVRERLDAGLPLERRR